MNCRSCSALLHLPESREVSVCEMCRTGLQNDAPYGDTFTEHQYERHLLNDVEPVGAVYASSIF